MKESNEERATGMARQVEDLNRGLVAISTSNGVYLSWRYLGTDSSSVVFDVYRDGIKVNNVSLADSSNYLDTAGNAGSSYYITAVLNGTIIDTSSPVTVYANNYFDIPLSIPTGGTTPDGVAFTYSANDASCADVDGDGEYEIILKWDPSNSKDNAIDGYTGNVIIDAYKLNGTLLWRIDLGINIRAGAHYTQFMVYDFDGDGFAEMVLKTADGTRDGIGTYIGDRTADYRNSAGRILDGPEYLTLFDGRTGAALHTVDYEPGRGYVPSWGDSYGNRVDRFLAGVAYLNGQTPSVVMCRGYYTRIALVAYDIVGKQLVKRWTFDSDTPGNSAFAGQGNHSLSVADVDDDGYDEIVYGACTINHDGTGLYSSGLGHGDALHVGDFLPDLSGLEIWSSFETAPYGAALRKASDGSILFRLTADSDTGRCIAGNFIPGNDSAEFAASSSPNLYNGSGNTVGLWSDITRWQQNFVVYWDGDLERAVMDRTMIDGYGKGRLLTASGVTYNNGSKANCCLSADILGDWREEVIWPAYDSSFLRVYMATDVTSYRIPTLMHDTQYRCQVASQNVGYNQPPHPSFFLGTGHELPEQPNVYAAGPMEGTFYLRNVHSDLYMDVAYGLPDNGTSIQQFSFNGSFAQMFRIVSNGDGYHYILTGASGYAGCVDIEARSVADGANVLQYTFNGNDNQMFRLVRNSDGSISILTKITGNASALEVYGFSTEPGGNIVQWSYWGGEPQRWYLIHAE